MLRQVDIGVTKAASKGKLVGVDEIARTYLTGKCRKAFNIRELEGLLLHRYCFIGAQIYLHIQYCNHQSGF